MAALLGCIMQLLVKFTFLLTSLLVYPNSMICIFLHIEFYDYALPHRISPTRKYSIRLRWYAHFLCLYKGTQVLMKWWFSFSNFGYVRKPWALEVIVLSNYNFLREWDGKRFGRKRSKFCHIGMPVFECRDWEKPWKYLRYRGVPTEILTQHFPVTRLLVMPYRFGNLI